jgi:hypothetical protein
MFCPDCQANLDDAPVDGPCPACGGLRRSAVAHAGVAAVRAEAHNPGLVIEETGRRPWGQKWQETLRRFDGLRAAYDPAAGRLEKADVQGRVESFFTECFHVGDWVKTDLTGLQGDVEKLLKESEPLRHCADICNTGKHRERDRGHQLAARVSKVTLHPDGGASVSIDLDCSRPSTTVRDAKDLAEECLAAWRGFFKQHGIQE